MSKCNPEHIKIHEKLDKLHKHAKQYVDTRSRGKYNRGETRIFKEREGHMTEEDEGMQMKS